MTPAERRRLDAWAKQQTPPALPGGGGGGGLVDGDYGDVTVSGTGTVINIDAGVVTTTELGGDITTAGKALLDDASAAAQRTTLGAAATSHTHAQADVTNLTTDLGAKAPLASPTLTGTPAAPTASPGDNTTQIATTAFVTAAVAGGSAGWSYVFLGSDFTTSATAQQAVTSFNFTPAASKTYEIYGQFLVRSAVAASGCRPGVTWPTGGTDGVVEIHVALTSGSIGDQHGNINAGVFVSGTGQVNNTQSWPASLNATLITGASPSGNFQITLHSETGGDNVTMKAGSWFKYKAIV